MWHHDVTNPRTCQFSAVCLTVFPFEFRPRIFTIGFYGKKLYHIRAYDFGVQFSFKLVFADPSFLHRASCCLVRYGVDHVAIVGVFPCTLIKTEDHRSHMGLAECKQQSESQASDQLWSGVHWRSTLTFSNSRRRRWKTQVLLEVGGGGILTFPVTGEGVQIHVPSELCRQGFRLKMRYLEP